MVIDKYCRQVSEVFVVPCSDSKLCIKTYILRILNENRGWLWNPKLRLRPIISLFPLNHTTFRDPLIHFSDCPVTFDRENECEFLAQIWQILSIFLEKYAYEQYWKDAQWCLGSLQDTSDHSSFLRSLGAKQRSSLLRICMLETSVERTGGQEAPQPVGAGH